jgi:hypothetical protein
MPLFDISMSVEAVTATVPRSLLVYARGAALAATLACPPERRDDPRTLDAYRALGRIALRIFQQVDPAWERHPQLVVPEHLLVSVDKLADAEPKLQRRLEDCLGAARIAAPFLQQAKATARGQDQRRSMPQVQASVMRTIDQEADRVEALRRHGTETPARFGTSIDNVETRVAREYLPVLHLASATAQMIEESQKMLARRPEAVRQQFDADIGGADGKVLHQFGLPELLLDVGTQQFIIHRAEQLEALLPFMPRLRPKRIVQFRLI